MNEFKVGDMLICISKKPQQDDLIIGGVFFVNEIHKEYVTVDGINYRFFANRFKKIDDNRLNRLLYPEAFDGV